MKRLIAAVIFAVMAFNVTQLNAQALSKMDLINTAKKEVGEITPKNLKRCSMMGKM